MSHTVKDFKLVKAKIDEIEERLNNGNNIESRLQKILGKIITSKKYGW